MLNIKDITYSALGAAVMTICAWISIPTPWHISFTMQTFGVFAVTGALGGKRGTISIVIYILLGLAGLPVFSGFKGGPGVLLGAAGGYILGFFPACVVMWISERLTDGKLGRFFIAAVIGLAACYAVGTVWYSAVFLKTISIQALTSALIVCVVPYIAFDFVKIFLAAFVTKKLGRCIKT